MSTVNYLLQKDSWLNENQHFNSIGIRMRKKTVAYLRRRGQRMQLLRLEQSPYSFPDRPLFFEPLLVMASCSSCHLYLRRRFHILKSIHVVKKVFVFSMLKKLRIGFFDDKRIDKTSAGGRIPNFSLEYTHYQKMDVTLGHMRIAAPRG